MNTKSVTISQASMLPTMGVGRGGQGLSSLDFQIWYFPINILVEKCISLSFELLKWNFTTVVPPGKNPPDAHAPHSTNNTL